MCWHVMITPGCSRVRGLTGRFSLWLTSAGLFIISYSQACDGPSCSFGACSLAQACMLTHSHVVKLSFVNIFPPIFVDWLHFGFLLYMKMRKYSSISMSWYPEVILRAVELEEWRKCKHWWRRNEMLTSIRSFSKIHFEQYTPIQLNIVHLDLN